MSDWIRMRLCLFRHPKVLAIARFLETSRAYMDWLSMPVRGSCKHSACERVTFDVTVRNAVTGLMLVWGAVCDSIGEQTDVVKGIDVLCLDAMAGIDGFGEAMAFAGWAVKVRNGIRFPNFREYNSPAKERNPLSNAERQKQYRDRKRNEKRNENVVTNVTKVTVDKRREEENVTPPYSPPQGGQEKKRRSRKETPEERTARLTARLMSYSKEPSNDGIPMAADPANPDRQLSDDGRRSDGGADPSMAGGNGRHHPQV